MNSKPMERMQNVICLLNLKVHRKITLLKEYIYIYSVV